MHLYDWTDWAAAVACGLSGVALGWRLRDTVHRQRARRSNFEPGMTITMGDGVTLRVVEVIHEAGGGKLARLTPQGKGTDSGG